VKARACALLAALTGATGCGDARHATNNDPSASDGGNTSSVFTEVELEVILHELGSLPAEPPSDPSNRFADDAAAASLGQKLFFETGYSRTDGPIGPVSCATCHIPSKGFQDDRSNTSQGIGFTSRHAPTLFNAAYGASGSGTVWQFWDGRKDSLWAQALGPPENPLEMGSTRCGVALLLYDKYKNEYENVFGPMPALRDDTGAAVIPVATEDKSPECNSLDPTVRALVTPVYVNFGKAIAAYERRIISRNSRFDQFYEEITTGVSTSDKLSEQEISGLKMFVGKGGCVSCHKGSNFSDWNFHSAGISQTGTNLPAEDRGRADGVVAVVRDEFNCMSEWSDQPDKTKCEVNELVARISTTGPEPSELGAFKTPSLRSVSLSAPYFHTGTLRTLDEVIALYDRGGDPSGFLGTVDENVRQLNLSDDEKLDLVAFLIALEGQPLDSSLLTDPRSP
jgi:cytochrome c peroxidase